MFKEVRFSVQCGASNRKSLATRRCSQCKGEPNDTELYPVGLQHRRRSVNSRSSSAGSDNYGNPSKPRTTTEKTPELDKFDTVLMLASEQKNHTVSCNKQHRCSTKSSGRKSGSLLIVEEQGSNHVQNIWPSHIQSHKNTGT